MSKEIIIPVVRILSTSLKKHPERYVSTVKWVSEEAFTEFELCAVSTPDEEHWIARPIPSEYGSIDLTGSNGEYPANVPRTAYIDHCDLYEVAPPKYHGPIVIKVFVRSTEGYWSV